MIIDHPNSDRKWSIKHVHESLCLLETLCKSIACHQEEKRIENYMQICCYFGAISIFKTFETNFKFLPIHFYTLYASIALQSKLVFASAKVVILLLFLPISSLFWCVQFLRSFTFQNRPKQHMQLFVMFVMCDQNNN